MIKNLLLRLYPAAWRREYGEEFAEMLCARPMTLNAIANVVQSALGQRLRQTPAWLVSGGLQFLSFVTWILLQCFGLLSPLGVRLIFPVEVLIQLGTGVSMVTKSNKGFVAGLAGTMAASLVAYTPLLLLIMLVSPPANFHDRAVLVHLKFVNAGRIFGYVMAWTAFLGGIGTFCGTMIRKYRAVTPIAAPRKES